MTGLKLVEETGSALGRGTNSPGTTWGVPTLPDRYFKNWSPVGDLTIFDFEAVPSPWVISLGATHTWSGSMRNAIEDLGRLQPDWAGPGSAAPIEDAIRDIQAFAPALPLGTRTPLVEIDPSDGEVKLAWRSRAEPRSVAISFSGNRKVCVVQSNLASPVDDAFVELDFGVWGLSSAARVLIGLTNVDLFTSE